MGKSMAFDRVPPAGEDRLVSLRDVRPGTWLLDPETNRWTSVKEIQKRPDFTCSWAAPQERTYRLSLRWLGERKLPPTIEVLIRIPLEKE